MSHWIDSLDGTKENGVWCICDMYEDGLSLVIAKVIKYEYFYSESSHFEEHHYFIEEDLYAYSAKPIDVKYASMLDEILGG